MCVWEHEKGVELHQKCNVVLIQCCALCLVHEFNICENVQGIFIAHQEKFSA